MQLSSLSINLDCQPLDQISESDTCALHDWLIVALLAYIALADAARNAFLPGTSTEGKLRSSICCNPTQHTTTFFILAL
jgi:hypothetical protein